MAHECHAAGCNVPVPPTMLMCAKHWRMVPKAVQTRVWANYRAGQCDDWQITHEYAEAARAAVRAVAEKERRTEDEIKAACAVYDMLDPAKTQAPEGPTVSVTLRAAVARNCTLQLQRTPMFLRFVWDVKANTWDALDQLDDEPRPEEHVFAARLAGTGSMHVDGVRGGKRAGWWLRTATYELVEPQPDDATMRDTTQWQAWAIAARDKEKAAREGAA